MDDEHPSKKRSRTEEQQETYDENAKRQRRIESLEILFGSPADCPQSLSVG